jgi:alpha-glucosidase
MPWDVIDRGGAAPGDCDRWDPRTFEVYRSLIALRRGSRALRDGGLRWAVVAPDAVAFVRETLDERVLVLVARSPWSGADLPRHLLAAGAEPENLYGGAALAVDARGLVLSGEGPGVQVWRLT